MEQRKRIGLWLAASFLALLVISCAFLWFGVSDQKSGGEEWALIKINGGEPLHVKAEKVTFYTSGAVKVETADRVYTTSADNVLIIKEKVG